MSQEGKSIAYPIRLDEQGDPVIIDGKSLLQQSVFDILSTPVGSRMDMPEYGSNLHKLMFEPNDDLIDSLLETYIEDALDRWENRLTFESLQITHPPDKPEVVYCRIIALNRVREERQVFTYPFYRELT